MRLSRRVDAPSPRMRPPLRGGKLGRAGALYACASLSLSPALPAPCRLLDARPFPAAIPLAGGVAVEGGAPPAASGAAGTIGGAAMALDVGLPGADLPPTDEEPPLPLTVATPQELRAHPGLARLLQGLGSALGPDGLSTPLERELRQAEAGLALQRGAWLRWESLRRGLQELLRDPQGLEPPVLQALEQALALAELRRGPPAFAPLLPPPQDPTPLRARLLPELERRLAEKAEELASYHGGPQNPPEGVAEELAAER
ncbi:HAUS augmin-like complex subunit 4, partial [Sarcoramphus papa]